MGLSKEVPTQLAEAHLSEGGEKSVPWFCGVHRMCRDGSSFMWHQPWNNQTALYIHHISGYSKTCYKKATVSHLESHALKAQ